jgi:hypothetical protein
VVEKERMEKRERWVKELEMRDEEDKAWKEKFGRGARKVEASAEVVKEEAKGGSAMVADKTKEAKEKVKEVVQK